MKECPVCHRCFPDNVNHCPSDGDPLRFTITGDTVLDGRYQLERRLGQGGMGLVFKARHIFLKTQHAIKVILPDLVGNDPSLLTRFRQEAMAAAAIQHPSVISVTDYGVINNSTPYLVMEFIEGRSLHDLIAEGGRIEPATALQIMTAVAAGVGAAHRQGIVHRDLKPLNIMLRAGMPPDEGVKILDFGLAKIKSGELLGSFVAAQTQGMMGSPFYMAPEQWGDEEPDRRADIYSLGVILYQMLTGDVPFKAGSIPAIMNKHLTSAPTPLAERGVPVPEAVEQVVRHALEKEPQKRPQSVEEFVAELKSALAELRRVRASAQTDAAIIDENLKTVVIKPDTLQQPTPGADELEEDAAHPSVGAVTIPEVAAPPATDAHATVASFSEQSHEQRHGQTHEQPPTPLTPPPPATRTQAPATGRETAAYIPDATGVQAAPAADGGRTHAEVAGAGAVEEAGEETVLARRQYASAAAVAKSRSRMPWAIVGTVVLVSLIGLIAGLLLWQNSRAEQATQTNTNADANAAGARAQPPLPAATPDLVEIPGGTFQMGREDVPPLPGAPPTSEAEARRLAWLYNQWPAHAVTVRPFAIDRTEVSNAEYAAFVHETGYPPPPDWEGGRPRAGQETWPVRNVSYEDAVRFAAWRSRRDGVQYRLPTEEEWEYVARAGNDKLLYPWGAEWSPGRANLDSAAPAPSGSFKDGATPHGVHDMIGNVWEWTSTEAAMYKGNNRLQLAPDDRGKAVVRGGSYQSKASGDEPVTATARRWLPKDRKDPVVGFRLVRSAP
ncbi:MAG TPA: SUMF1/EgtB/PvdO family nonheme iron enzyme [Pyrinomonadaceae bacterium]|nr:SUMF1/EgtB/PvdO family nonheme iron enzyme [Pyrinomonadaceae bacterium]